MNNKLVQLYIEGIEKGYLTHWGSWLNYSTPESFYKPLFNEESKLGSDDESFERKETNEWRKAQQLLSRKKLGYED